MSTVQTDPANTLFFYDAAGNCERIELHDSVSPTTSNLRTIYGYTYSPTMLTRTATTVSTGRSARVEYTIDANKNITKEAFFNFSGTLSTERTYSGYDSKINPLREVVFFVLLIPGSANNWTNSTYKDFISGGGIIGTTGAQTYNSDGYPIRTEYGTAGDATIYTYVKK